MIRPPASRLPALLVAAALVVASLATPPSVRAKDDPAAARREAAAALAALAKACADDGAKTAATEALEEARTLDGDAPGLAEAAAAVEALGEDAGDAKAKADARRKALGPAVAKAYDRLAAAVTGDPSDAALAKALRHEPSKPRIGRAHKRIEEALKADKPWAAARVMAAVRAAEPGDARLVKLELDLAKDFLLLGSADHPLLAYVSLPKSWQKGKKYPVLVGVEGAGSSFLGYARGSASARGSRAAILVVPVSLSNTNALDAGKYPHYPAEVLEEWGKRRMDFDGPGMERVLELVRTRFGGDDKVFVTGFSGGGNYCYWKLFSHPSSVRGAAPACANFSGYGIAEAPPAGEDGGPVVKLMTGAKDEHRDHVFGTPPGIEGQTDAAEAKLKELGYRHVTRVMWPNVGHSPLHAEVWKFVDEVLARR